MTTQEVKANLKHHWEECGMNIDTDCTCNKCYPDPNERVKCSRAFDTYNFNGDCLAGK